MWKNRSNSAPRPQDASSRLPLRHPTPARIVPPSSGSGRNAITNLMPNRGRSPSPGPANFAAAAPAARPSTTTPGRSSSSFSKLNNSSSNRYDSNNNNNNNNNSATNKNNSALLRGGGTSAATQRRQSPSPRSKSPSQAQQQYFDSLSRPRSPHVQLRDEISTLRCRIQRTDAQLRARAAAEAKNQKIMETFEQAKQLREQHERIRRHRNSAQNKQKQDLWMAQKEQQAATKQRMQLLFHEKHEEARTDKSRIQKIQRDASEYYTHAASVQKDAVLAQREGRKYAMITSAVSQAQKMKQCREEFNHSVGLVTKLSQSHQEAMLERKRQRLEKERAEAEKRRHMIRQQTAEGAARKREEIEAVLNEAKKIEAQMLIREKKMLLVEEKRLSLANNSR